MSRKKNKNYNTYLWQQMPNKLIRSKMLRPSILKYVEDSDNSVDENEELMKQGMDGDYYALRNNIRYERVQLL